MCAHMLHACGASCLAIHDRASSPKCRTWSDIARHPAPQDRKGTFVRLLSKIVARLVWRRTIATPHASALCAYRLASALPYSHDATAVHLSATCSACLQADLVKDGGHHYFISSLDVNEPGMSPDSRAQAAFVLAVICDGHKRGRLVCGEQGLLQKLLSLLSNMVGARPAFTAESVLCEDVCGNTVLHGRGTCAAEAALSAI